MDYILIGLVLLAIPFVLPIVSWIYAYGTRSRVRLLEDKVEEQARRIEALSERLRAATRATSAPSAAPTAPTPAAEPPAAPPATPPTMPAPPVAAVEPARPAPAIVPQPPPTQATERPSVAAAVPVPPPAPERPPTAPIVPAPQPAAVTPSATPPRPPAPPTHPAPPRAPQPPQPPSAGFDWEGLVGVRLFSAIAGIALVIAAISFLRYSIEHGWIEPPVRVAIGVVAAIVLLVLCELKAARKYPFTANAMDAAAIAILFSTFFAAHALWNLIGSGATFVLLALVTAVAVLLSIRRESLFIAVLGLLGGFATPILLSTGENQPIPLFTYLLLLNIGLAWVAYRKGWTLLTILTLALTTVYQWGWVFKFLSVSQLPLAMGIFVVFPVTALALLVLGSRETAPGARTFERTAAIGSAAPLLFAIYLAAVPEYGAHAGLLFGFLFLLAAGLFAIALALGRELLHAAGAVTTLLVFTIHRINHPAPLPQILLFDALFIVFYLAAPTIAERIGREFDRDAAGSQGSAAHSAEAATLAAPLLLFVPATLAGTTEAASPLFLFAVLFVLVCLVSLRAVAAGEGVLYFVAMFFVVAAEAHWSIRHLTDATLGSAVVVYAAFGVLQLGIPLAARRWAEPLRPRAGAGVTLIASLGMLLFLAIGGVAPVALWGLALLLALLNAALFVESAAEDLPALSIVGGLASWLVLAVWWWDAAGAVDVMSSLLVMLGLSLVMLGGHAWAHARSGRPPSEGVHFSHGVYLGLMGYLFLFFVAVNPAWSVPPSPLFGALAVLTLAVATTALVTRVRALHVASIAAAGIVLLSWTVSVGDAPWPSIALLGGAVLAVFALTWIPLFDARTTSHGGAIAAVVALFASEGIAVAAGGHGASAPGVLLLALSHAVTLTVLLGTAWRYRWHDAALASAFPAALALFVWRLAHIEKSWWAQFLAFAGVIYAVLTAYPFVLGRRARQLREPHLLAIAASAIFFFAARDAFIAGDLRWMIGAVPVAEGLVLALLLRQLLGIEEPGQRDLGRLALVAGAALAFLTVAIPLQLRNQWITIGWALEGAALAWLYTRIAHRGLLYSAVALLATAFLRLAINPAVFQYQPRGVNRVLNWYLYAYAITAVAMLAASWWLSRTRDNLVADGGPLGRASRWLPAAACILLFELLNIEIADFYAAGPEITFRFGATLAQDLTYTIGWLIFGMLLLAAGIALGSHAARVAALVLITVTTFKCFLYDLSSLGGLYRVASFVGLGVSLALVSLALQKYVLVRSQETTS